MSVLITREPDDPLAPRAAMATIQAAGDGNYYLVHRGDPGEVLDMLREVIQALQVSVAQQPQRPQG